MPLLPEIISPISALKVLMKSRRFWSWKTGPQQQVEHEQDMARINEYFGNPMYHRRATYRQYKMKYKDSITNGQNK